MLIVGLYNGVGWLTFGRTLGLGARFGVYEILSAFYKGKFLLVVYFLCEFCFMAKYAGVASLSIKISLWCAMCSNPREWRNYFEVRNIDLFGTKQINIANASTY